MDFTSNFILKKVISLQQREVSFNGFSEQLVLVK